MAARAVDRVAVAAQDPGRVAGAVRADSITDRTTTTVSDPSAALAAA